jgi:hypothetical protein
MKSPTQPHLTAPLLNLHTVKDLVIQPLCVCLGLKGLSLQETGCLIECRRWYWECPLGGQLYSYSWRELVWGGGEAAGWLLTPHPTPHSYQCCCGGYNDSWWICERGEVWVEMEIWTTGYLTFRSYLRGAMSPSPTGQIYMYLKYTVHWAPVSSLFRFYICNRSHEALF